MHKLKLRCQFVKLMRVLNWTNVLHIQTIVQSALIKFVEDVMLTFFLVNMFSMISASSSGLKRIIAVLAVEQRYDLLMFALLLTNQPMMLEGGLLVL